MVCGLRPDLARARALTLGSAPMRTRQHKKVLPASGGLLLRARLHLRRPAQ